jgi:hypothetical protein
MLSLVGRPEFDGNLDEVAGELSSLCRGPHDLETAADHLEALCGLLAINSLSPAIRDLFHLEQMQLRGGAVRIYPCVQEHPC